MSGWCGGSSFFVMFFYLIENYHRWFCFFIFLEFVHGFLELGGHFFCDFGVLGSSLDVFGARRETTLWKYTAPFEPLWLHFGVLFGVKWLCL